MNTELLLEKQLEELKKINFIKRLWEKDATIWKEEENEIDSIKNALGWLDISYKMLLKTAEIKNFTKQIKEEKYKNAVVLGMGGSSLAPEVFSHFFQKNNYPKLYILDTTNPDAIYELEKKIKLKETLFIFSSKSGDTIEPNSQFKYFYSKLQNISKNPGNNFIAITDKGTSLESLALDKKFKKIFINPKDIGGRFSALSYFGLIPLSICGGDIDIFLKKAVNTVDQSQKENLLENPGILLGSFLGKNFLEGKDKLTLILPEKLKVFALWIEQLISESTGKEGKGFSVVYESEVYPEYTKDRVFVYIDFKNSYSKKLKEDIDNLNFPVFKILIDDLYDISKEIFIWEIATATAGYFLHINPFNQPNVQFSKTLTIKTIENFKKTKILEDLKEDFSSKEISVYLSDNLKNKKSLNNNEDFFFEILNNLKENDYFRILAYLDPSKENDKFLNSLIDLIRKEKNNVSFFSYGPRYLHSSGQIFKGGQNNGMFLILTSKVKNDIKIKGEEYSFWQLHMAQAIGDFKALNSMNRRVIRLHIKSDKNKTLKDLTKRITKVENNSSNLEGKMPKTMEKKKNIRINNTKTTTKTNEYVVIDHPKNLETITSNHYTIRIGASNCVSMEISIDDQQWQNARYSVGYWWYDWNNIQTGSHQIVARMNLGNGKYIISTRRRCKVS